GRLASTIIQVTHLGTGSQLVCGLGTDAGGFNSSPEARGDAKSHPLRYPFNSFDGQVQFKKQRSGRRVYDLNSDGVAHYGLYADLLADIQRVPSTKQALSPLFRSAGAYLHMWGRAVAHH